MSVSWGGDATNQPKYLQKEQPAAEGEIPEKTTTFTNTTIHQAKEKISGTHQDYGKGKRFPFESSFIGKAHAGNSSTQQQDSKYWAFTCPMLSIILTRIIFILTILFFI